MAKSTTPMTDAVNTQFDEWDARIDALKDSASEWAKQQLEDMKESIQEWAEKKIEELKGDEEETENPVEGLEPPTSVDDCVSKLTKTIAALKKIATMITQTIVDSGLAAAAVATRTPQTISKITGGIDAPGGVGGGIPSVPGVGLSAKEPVPVGVTPAAQPTESTEEKQ